jgi:hypothetical protein
MTWMTCTGVLAGARSSGLRSTRFLFLRNRYSRGQPYILRVTWDLKKGRAVTFGSVGAFLKALLASLPRHLFWCLPYRSQLSVATHQPRTCPRTKMI